MLILPESFPAAGLPLVSEDDEHMRLKARASLVLTQSDVRSCCRVVEVGIFFDGTNNNMERDLPRKGHTNVVRLFNAYQDQPNLYKYAHYIPGVGTKCNEVGETNPNSLKVKMLGLAFAGGGWGRILLGCVQLLNSIHRALVPDASLLKGDAAISARINSVLPNFTSPATMRAKLQSQFASELSALRDLVKRQPKPSIRLISLSVFGFSRGAAQARSFVNAVQGMCDAPGQWTIAGMPIELKFVGLFDTVASVGPLLNSVNSSASVYLGVDGRMLWARPVFLALPPGTPAVHFVAAHEQRRSFPLDLLPGATLEHVYPGMHSDVGGGYNPREEGRSLDGNARDMLARIACMNMYRQARRAGVPLYALDQMPAGDPQNDFAPVPPALVNAFNNYLALRGTGERDAYAEMQAQSGYYLRWRGTHVDTYESTRFYGEAPRQDRQDLKDANEELKRHMATPSGTDPGREWARVQVRAGLGAAEKAACEALFSGYTHDSIAGFLVFGSTRTEMAHAQKKVNAAYERALEDFQKVPALRASTHRYVGRTLSEPAVPPAPPRDVFESDDNTWMRCREPFTSYLQKRRVFPVLHDELVAEEAEKKRLALEKSDADYRERQARDLLRRQQMEAREYSRTRS